MNINSEQFFSISADKENFEGKEDIENYKSIVKYLQPDFVELHKYVYANIKGVIASDMDFRCGALAAPYFVSGVAGRTPMPSLAV